jgi:FG-GAP-like repeat/FG-GAP repeat
MPILRSKESLKVAALLGCVTVANAIASPPPTFNAPLGYRTGGFAEMVATADVNNDTHPDVISVNLPYNLYSPAPASVAILLGTGQENFRQPVTYTIGKSPTALVIGDFNGDGKPDIAVSDSADFRGAGYVSILLGNGDGTFQPPVNYPAGPGPIGLAIGDFNGDGHPDLAVADYGLSQQPSSTVSILFGNGDGTFQAPVAVAAASQPKSITVADFNGDGYADMAVTAYSSGDILVLLGNGDGTFQTPAPATVGAGAGQLGAVVTADFNGDGIPDLAVPWSNYSSYFTVLLGNGNGAFQPPRTTTCNCSNLAPVVGDFNGDGTPDVVSIGANGAYFTLLGKGDGTFQPEIAHLSAYLSALAVADFNHDGKLDLAAAGYDVFILMGNGAGYFAQAIPYPVAGLSLAVGDFNGDGKPDVAAVAGNGATDGTITILLNGTRQMLTFAAPYAYLLAVGDFNLDGKADLAVANTEARTVSIYTGNGNGTFQTPSTYPAGQTPYSMVVADFNRDGKPDLAVANFASNTVSIFLGNGNGTLQPQTTYGVGTNPIWMAAADFNGDGKTDLAIANSGSNSVSILLGKGDGAFSPQMTSPVTSLPSFVAVGDFNGDGYPDLVVTNPGILTNPGGVPGPRSSPATNSNLVGVLLGNGDGTFQPQVQYEVGPEPYSVAVADFNGDGILDLAVGNIGDAAVSILLGNGDGSFRHEVVDWFTGSDPFPLVLADMNGDGKPDMVTGGPVTVLTNTTSSEP